MRSCRPCERRDPYRVIHRMSTAAETFRTTTPRWLWVPAFAGTTNETRNNSQHTALATELRLRVRLPALMFPCALLHRRP